MRDACRGGWVHAIVLAALSALAVSGIAGSAVAAADRVTAAAVWRPDPGFMDRFHAECRGLGGQSFVDCFVSAIAKTGAGAAVLDFTRRLDGEGYLEGLDATGGPIAVAHVFYAFRANENNAWLLVDGTPPLIDVDDQHYLALDAMRAGPAYREIQRRFPDVAFWPGDRGAQTPKIAMGGQQVIVDYRLRNLCHACAIVGQVWFAFNFDHSGTFLGTRLVSVVPADR